MPKKDVIILNDYKAQNRKLSGGRVGVKVTAEPLIHDFDAQKLAHGPAQAIRDRVEKAIKSITEPSAASTIARRRRAGISGSKLFNATGRLARGLFVAEAGDGYETRAPADRLTGLPRDVVSRLFEVAGISAKELVKDRDVRKAIELTPGVMIRKGRRK